MGEGKSGAVSKAPRANPNNPATSRVLTDTSMKPDRELPSSRRRQQTCGQQVQAPLKIHHYSVHCRHLPHQVTGRQDEIGLAGSVSSRTTLASLMESRCLPAPHRLSCSPSGPLGAWARQAITHLFCIWKHFSGVGRTLICALKQPQNVPSTP